jgi:hypothetical protein
MKLAAIAMTAAALAFTGCGGSGSGEESTSAATGPVATAPANPTTVGGKLPPGAVAPSDTVAEATVGPAATEASPEAEAIGPRSSGELSGADRTAVTAAVREYVAALDRREAGRVCALIAPGGLDLGELPRRAGGCRSSLAASIGTRPRGGGPAWRRTRVVEVKPERLGDDRARITATVTHHFTDRKYVSVEDDVIYLERAHGHWLLAKPSATFYRAVGYAQPPLRAFSPPRGW